MLLVPLLGACDDTWRAAEGRANREVQQVKQKALSVSDDTLSSARKEEDAATQRAQTISANLTAAAHRFELEVRNSLQDGRESIEHVAHSALLKVDPIDEQRALPITEDERRNQR